jgi:NADH-quinone oxidoreductase subunit J
LSPIFYLLAALTLAGGLATVLLKQLVHCALAVTVAFAGLALLFLQLDAQFAGFAQILVYIGAVAILIVFAILLTRGSDLPKRLVSSAKPGLRARDRRGRLCRSRMGGARQRESDSAAEYRPDRHRTRHRQRACRPLCVAARNCRLLLTAATIGAVIVAMHEKERPR